MTVTRTVGATPVTRGYRAGLVPVGTLTRVEPMSGTARPEVDGCSGVPARRR